MSERNGNWIETCTGRRFWPLDPRPEDVSIIDITNALGNKCRFTGQCNPFYSVAQHSVIVSFEVPAEHALWGLLHDASEAYLPDVSRPLKGGLNGFREIEARVMRAVAEHFRLPWPEPPEVKQADTAVLLAEREQLMPKTGRRWSVPGAAAAVAIDPLGPSAAQIAFWERYGELVND